VNTLEKYAKSGIVDQKLAVYQRYLPQAELEKLRRILLQPVKINPAIAAQFLATQQGEFLLRRLAESMTVKSHQHQSEIPSLRSALISAAREPEGLTLLNLLRKYPQSSIDIDIVHSLEIAGELEKLINETHQAIALIKQKSAAEAVISPEINLAQLPDLPTTRKWNSQKYTTKFFDSTRKRLLLTDIYLPQTPYPVPVIVISHGLGLDSSNFRYLAHNLAARGFAVIVPNHPGSDAQQLRSPEHSNSGGIIAPREFIDRPLDVTYILDQLEKGNKSDLPWRGRLNLQQVGVFGQSFGGYTALALAGAEINFDQLNQDCQPEALENTWNMSLFLQCRALELQHQSGQNVDLRDRRVKAAIAVNPITSSIFGKMGLNQIKTPVMMIGSSEDTVAPALSEQILPFSWLTKPQKYLVMLLGATHFSTIGRSQPGTAQLALSPDMVGNAPQARSDINAVSFLFFKAYVTGMSNYIPYLSASYMQSISSDSIGLSIIHFLSTQTLLQKIDPDSELTLSGSKISYFNRQFWLLNIGYWCFLATWHNLLVHLVPSRKL
jgi:predicted dienelactone hydrolase